MIFKEISDLWKLFDSVALFGGMSLNFSEIAHWRKGDEPNPLEKPEG